MISLCLFHFENGSHPILITSINSNYHSKAMKKKKKKKKNPHDLKKTKKKPKGGKPTFIILFDFTKTTF